MKPQKKKLPLTFQHFSDTNRARCEEAFHPIKDWDAALWIACACGEIGEAANWIKKIYRLQSKNNAHLTNKQREKKGKQLLKEVSKEIADVICYLDLLAAYYDFNLEEILTKKFNEVSKRVKSNRKL